MLDTILRGHYKIISHLGGGGFGQTYLAEDIDLPTHPTCVVKLLKPVSHESFVMEIAKRLFDREAEILYSLGSHDRIPRLLAHFQEGEDFYLVQEFADGEDLTQELGNGRRSPEVVAIALLKEVLEILVFVHERGVVHRDIKPANLIRRKSDRKIVLIDFGAVKEIGGLAVESQGNTNLTIAVGSPGYMPIEQLNGKPRFSSDIYAVGMMTIQAITGAEPRLFVEHPDTAELIWRDRLSSSHYSAQFLDILDKMICYDFRQRYQTVQEVLEAIAAMPNSDDHDLPTVINGSNKNLENPITTSSKVTTQSQDLSTNVKAPNNLNRFSQTNIDEQKQNRYWLKILIIGGSVVVISVAVAIIRYSLPSKTELISSITIPPVSLPEAKSAEELLLQAVLLNRNNKPQEALVKVEDALKLDPKSADAWAAKGFTLDKLDRDSEAIAAYDKAIEIRPEFPFARQSRAILSRKPKSKK